MKFLGGLVLALLLTSIILSGCGSKTNAKNYFAEVGIKLPSSSNDTVNQIIAGFPKL